MDHIHTKLKHTNTNHIWQQEVSVVYQISVSGTLIQCSPRKTRQEHAGIVPPFGLGASRGLGGPFLEGRQRHTAVFALVDAAVLTHLRGL